MTPMIVNEVHADEFACPYCFDEITYGRNYDFCSSCGQALDWSDEDE